MGIRAGIIVGLFLLGACSSPSAQQSTDQDEVKTTYSEEFLQLWNVCDSVKSSDNMTDFQIETRWYKEYSKLPSTVKVLGVVDNVVYDRFGPTLFLNPPDKRTVSIVFGRMTHTQENVDLALKINIGDVVVVSGKLDKETSCQPKATGGFSVWLDVETTDVIPK